MECSIWIFKWRHLMGKFRINAGSVIWPKLEPMECLTWTFLPIEFAYFVAGEIIQVIEAMPGSVVPLAMFPQPPCWYCSGFSPGPTPPKVASAHLWLGRIWSGMERESSETRSPSQIRSLDLPPFYFFRVLGWLSRASWGQPSHVIITISTNHHAASPLQSARC